ncbi:PAS domain S-box protein [Rubellimicrobium rubrum]|uniref:histidine kinase n=1 Tax=Rubellimicrobium rubrum TaxID=2585369 RepID=A0A5C4MP15_9RHOB|nr:hybrid sensor histidine kinase/response regulator [Rubellimicrobium rubrum]TNC46151.1 PAS domain S-box protein [Rubellimicrobium rubrum]
MTQIADDVLAGSEPDLASLILDSATDFAILTVDEQGIITSWSLGAQALMGWSSAEAVGLDAAMIFTPADQEAGTHKDEMARARLDGRSVNERWHLRKDGSRFWGSGLLMPLKDGARGQGYVKIMRDRTTELEADRRYQALTDALPGFVFVTDADGHNTEVNALYSNYTGRDTQDLLGDRWLTSIHEEDRKDAVRFWQQSVADGTDFQARLRFQRADGAHRCFDCRAVAQRDDSGRVVRWIGTCIDVEEREQAHHAVALLNRSLEQAMTERTAELESAIAERMKVEEALRQSQKMEAIGQLTGGVAHDFNNLLTVITSSIGFLRRDNLPAEKRHRYIEAIAETAERATQLTRQLLAFARRQALVPEVFDAVERVQNLSGMLRSVLGSRIEIVTEVHCDHCPVEADPTQFDAALINMAVNARDAMDGEGRFTIALRAKDSVPPVRGHARVSGDFIVLSVTDTGEGIPPDCRNRVFEPFFTTKEVGKGTGLGLSQVFGFVKQSGGEVDVRSVPGQGATFTIYLPRARREARQTEVRAETPPDTDRIKGCVLVVEDNRLVGEFAARLLEDLGFGTIWVASAKDALDHLEATPDRFAVVFTDVVMPGMSGIELAREVRKRAIPVPVVLTSGYSHVLAEEGTHGFDLLHKPYSVEGLSRVLRQAMSGR